jgi:hypothetical protein
MVPGENERFQSQDNADGKKDGRWWESCKQFGQAVRTLNEGNSIQHA